jgi:hypothetical protein
MILQEKIPGLTANYFLGSSPSAVQGEALKEIRKESVAREALEVKIAELDHHLISFRGENEKLLKKISELEKNLRVWRAGTMIFTLTLIFSVFIWILWARRGFF